MKSKFLLLIVSVITLTVFGCSGVEIKAPLPAINLSESDADKITGVWSFTNNGMLIESPVFVELDDNGVFQMAMVEWKNNDFVLERSEFVVSEGNDNLIISLRQNSENGKSPEDVYMLVSFAIADGGDIVLWETDISAFEKLVADGVLQGSVRTGAYERVVSLTSTVDEILTIIRSSDNRDLFKFKEPHVMRKISSVLSD